MKDDALVRLAELRRRQGRLAEAAVLVEQVPSHGSGLLERARLALDGDDARGALEFVEKYLRHLPVHDRTDRASCLEIVVRARTDLRDWEGAKVALDDLAGILSKLDAVPMRADLSFAAGYTALGQGKVDEARRSFEDACDLYMRSGAPFETAWARIQLARALGALGRIEAAIEQLNRGKALFFALNAELEVARTEKLRAELLLLRKTNASASAKATTGELSKREIEVLRLVAQGLSNQSIAEQLFVSDHTVH